MHSKSDCWVYTSSGKASKSYIPWLKFLKGEFRKALKFFAMWKGLGIVAGGLCIIRAEWLCKKLISQAFWFAGSEVSFDTY